MTGGYIHHEGMEIIQRQKKGRLEWRLQPWREVVPQASQDSPHTFSFWGMLDLWHGSKNTWIFHVLLYMTTLDTFCHPNAPRSWEYLIRRLQEPHEPPPFHHHHTSAALSLNMQTCSPQQVASYKNDEKKMGGFSTCLTKSYIYIYLQIPPQANPYGDPGCLRHLAMSCTIQMLSFFVDGILCLRETPRHGPWHLRAKKLLVGGFNPSEKY